MNRQDYAQWKAIATLLEQAWGGEGEMSVTVEHDGVEAVAVATRLPDGGLRVDVAVVSVELPVG